MSAETQSSFVLPSALTATTAATTHEALLAAINAGASDLEIDGAAVTSADAAGLQLLVAARRELAERDRTMRITAPSATLAAAVQDLSLQRLLLLEAAT